MDQRRYFEKNQYPEVTEQHMAVLLASIEANPVMLIHDWTDDITRDCYYHEWEKATILLNDIRWGAPDWTPLQWRDFWKARVALAVGESNNHRYVSPTDHKILEAVAEREPRAKALQRRIAPMTASVPPVASPSTTFVPSFGYVPTASTSATPARNPMSTGLRPTAPTSGTSSEPMFTPVSTAGYASPRRPVPYVRPTRTFIPPVGPLRNISPPARSESAVVSPSSTVSFPGTSSSVPKSSIRSTQM